MKKLIERDGGEVERKRREPARGRKEENQKEGGDPVVLGGMVGGR